MYFEIGSRNLTSSKGETLDTSPGRYRNSCVDSCPVWCFYYVRGRVKVLETEISNAELEAVTCLKAHPEWREQFEHSSATTRLFTVGDASAGGRWEVYDRQRPLLLAFWGCALYVMFLFAQAWS